MRVAIISPPKSGNHWIKCLLSKMYGLKQLAGRSKPLGSPAEVKSALAEGSIPDDSIFHLHARFTTSLADAYATSGVPIVTIVRDPYDIFVSLVAWVQNRSVHESLNETGRPRDTVIGKPFDHPDVLAFLENEFGANLQRANDWLHSGRAIVVRYEGLHSNPVAELTRVTDQIEPVPVSRLTEAIEWCRAENMRQRNKKAVWHLRTAKVGDSKERLTDAHLAIFRDRYSDSIRSLGYEVR